MARIPRDVREQLEAAGVKFDDEGNIIEDETESFIEDDEEDDIEDEDDEIENDEDDESEVEEEDEDEVDDDDEEEEEEEPQPRKKKKKPSAKAEETEDAPKLTPRQVVEKQKEDDLTIEAIRDNVKSLLEKYNFSPTDDDVVEDEGTEESVVLAELRKEVSDFRKMRYASFADTVKQKVSDKALGASFQDIINSSQWDEFLNTSAYGRKIGQMYQEAVRSQDTDAVLFFFDDFASRYLKRPVEVKEEKSVKQNDLDDLAVPDKTKTSTTPRRKKYDFEEDDYAIKLDEAERGVITREQFVKFNDAFESALSKGRVKPSR